MINPLRAAAFAVLAVAGLRTGEAAPHSVTLHLAAPPVGSKWIEHKVRTVELTLSANGTEQSMTSEGIETRRVDVLEVVGNAVTKASYTFAKLTDVRRANGQEKSVASTIAGKTYTLNAGTPIKVATKTGPAPEAEANEVRSHEKRFGTPDRLGKVLDGRRFTEGTAVALSAPELASVSDDGTRFTKMALTYRGMTGIHARFAIALTLEAEPSAMTAELAGELVIDPKTTMVVSSSVQGKLKVGGNAPGGGTMRMTSTNTAR